MSIMLSINFVKELKSESEMEKFLSEFKAFVGSTELFDTDFCGEDSNKTFEFVSV